MTYAGVADRDAIEAEQPYEDRDLPKTMWEMLSRTAGAHGPRKAVTYQIFSDPGAKEETFTWSELQARTAQTANLLKIQARSIIDFSAAYDIVDVANNQKVGALRRKGLKSILKDSWQILDNDDREIGSVSEDSMGMALLRRFLTNLIPQSFDIMLGETKVGLLKQTFNPFVPQFQVDFSADTSNQLDRRLGIGTVVLLQVIEGRQN